MIALVVRQPKASYNLMDANVILAIIIMEPSAHHASHYAANAITHIIASYVRLMHLLSKMEATAIVTLLFIIINIPSHAKAAIHYAAHVVALLLLIA